MLAMTVSCAPINHTVMGQETNVKIDSVPKNVETIKTPIDENKYLPALNKLERKYQIRSVQLKETYQIFPIVMYPFFCLPKETVCSICPPNIRTLYLKQGSIVIREYSEGVSYHLQVAFLHSTQGRTPWARIYTLHFMRFDANGNCWKEEKNPISVTMILTDREKGIYAAQ